MFLKRKLTVLATVALLSSSLLAGCSTTKDEGDGGSDKGKGGAAKAEDVLGNKNARAALAMAVDKQAYCDVILNNGSIPTDRFIPKGLANDNGKDYTEITGEMGYKYDLEAAKEAWAKAKEEVGFDTAEIEFLTFDSEGGKRTGEFIQAELAKLDGLTIKLTNLPFEQKLERETNGDFDMSFAGWGPDYPDPLTFLDTMRSGNQYAKQVGYTSETFDKLVEEATKLPKADGYKKYAEAEKLMLEDGYIAPLYQKGTSYLEKEYVKDLVRTTWGADYIFTYADVDKEDKTLNRVTASDIPSLDVSKATDQESFQTLSTTMEGLTRVDGEGKAQPGVAEKWEASEDGLTWTFNLRKNSTWSNGTPVTAKDFEYSWNRTLDPATASEYSYIMTDVESFKAIDDSTFEVKLKRPIEYFAELMSFQTFFPQNQAFVEQCGENYGQKAEYQLYNGPFTLTSWKPEDQYTVEKNPNYWDASNVKLKKINTKVVKDTGAAINLYDQGEIDFVGLSSDYVDKYKADPNFKTAEGGSVFFLQVNGGKGAAKK